MNYEKPKIRIVSIDFKDVIAASKLPLITGKEKEGHTIKQVNYDDLFKF